MGYISLVNGKRTISFDPRDNFVGKNVAQLPATEIPDASSPEYDVFMADIIAKVKISIQNKSEAQRQAIELLSSLRQELEKVEKESETTALMKKCTKLPQVMKAPFFNEVKTALTEKGFVFEDGKFKKQKENDNETQK